MTSSSSNAWIQLQYLLSTSLSNIDSTRIRQLPSVASSSNRRKEGWTEQFGVLEKPSTKEDDDGDDGKENDGNEEEDPWQMEEESVLRMREFHDPTLTSPSQTPSPPPSCPTSIPILLTQHRTAWQEQLYLRITNIPHIVRNSPYHATESTGPLPHLLHLNKHVWIGRRHLSSSLNPTKVNEDEDEDEDESKGDEDIHLGFGGAAVTVPPIRSGSDIIDYFQTIPSTNTDNNAVSKTTHNLDQNLTPNQLADGRAYASLIHRDLDTILRALRYGDSKLWNDIYKPRCVRARILHSRLPFDTTDSTTTTTGTGKRSWEMLSWFQPWSERTASLQELYHSSISPSSPAKDYAGCVVLFPNRYRGSGSVHIGNAIGLAKECYTILDARLAANRQLYATRNTTQTESDNDMDEDVFVGLLSTSQQNTPTTVDTILFAHLAEALCDVHLVRILAEYNHLIRFFLKLYETYFGSKYCVSTNPNVNDSDGNKRENWIEWNDAVNSTNQFHHIPIGEDDGIVGVSSAVNGCESAGGAGAGADAAVLMQSIARFRRRLDPVLKGAALQRHQEEVLAGLNRGGRSQSTDGVSGISRGLSSLWFSLTDPNGLLYRMRMDGDLFTWYATPTSSSCSKSSTPSASSKQRSGGEGGGGAEQTKANQKDDGDDKEDEMKRKNRKLMEKMERDAKKNDELWVSGVLVGSFLGLMLASAKSDRPT